ncbi:MAG TPA: iron ABC transporter permease [Opitutales bacterium]|nr:iron ABC transporter permease [Opitutales bacterium]
MEALARKRLWVLAALAVLVVALAMISASYGAYEKVRAPEVWRVLVSKIGLGHSQPDARVETVVMELRLPRVALAILAGVALGLAGATLQGLFRNPLADPALIGVSGGAALGAVVVIVLLQDSLHNWLGEFGVPVGAMDGALAVTFLIYHLSRVDGRTNAALMLLTGLALNALVGSAIGITVYLASDEQLREWIFWSLGSLGHADWVQIGVAALFIGPTALGLLMLAKPLNVLLLGEAEAMHLGVPVQRVKRTLVLCSALLAGAAVSVCGTIGFVGLMAPHLVRLMLGPDHRTLLPASALLGAALLLASDIAARGVGGFEELPIGVVTALVGAPIFLLLLLRARRKGEF